jgi:tetrahydromethanopterin S-methyltransferase subunit C
MSTMHKQVRNKLVSLTFASLLLAVVAIGVYHPPVAALFDNSKSTACSALGNSCASGNTAVTGTVGNIIKILSFIVGIVAVIMVIIGALRYITSNGDSNQISSAKNTIIYALIGLVVAVLAQAIVLFVFNRL